MKLRYAAISDSSRVNELYEVLDKAHRVVHTDRFQEPDVHGRTIEYQMDLINNPNTILVVAEENQEVIGFIEGRIMKSSNFPVLRERIWLQINSLVVDKKHRCRGTGQALFDYIIKWSKSKDVNSVELNVYTFNESAISFYRKNGFGEIMKTMSRTL